MDRSTDSRDACQGLAHVIACIGDKWAVMIVGHLSEKPNMRFNELLRAIPAVSHRMLTLTLRNLEREGLVTRTAFATVPPRVEYALTELGNTLTGPLSQLAAWAKEHRRDMEISRNAFDREKAQ